MIENKNYSYKFDDSKCSSCDGNCCIGESGYIWINHKEIEYLSKHLEMSNIEVIKKYLYKVGNKYSIKENLISENNFACCFFDLGKKQCGIYEARPKQCRTFPFWNYFKSHIDELKEECPAIID